MTQTEEKEFLDNPKNSESSVEIMAKNFSLMVDPVRVEWLLQKYGRERLLRDFRPILDKCPYPRAQAALKLLRGEISVEIFLIV